jgi:hypothetical protein
MRPIIILFTIFSLLSCKGTSERQEALNNFTDQLTNGAIDETIFSDSYFIETANVFSVIYGGSIDIYGYCGIFAQRVFKTNEEFQANILDTRPICELRFDTTNVCLKQVALFEGDQPNLCFNGAMCYVPPFSKLNSLSDLKIDSTTKIVILKTTADRYLLNKNYQDKTMNFEHGIKDGCSYGFLVDEKNLSILYWIVFW